MSPRLRYGIAALAGALIALPLGVVAGYGIGSTQATKQQHDEAVRDGRAIHEDITRAADAMRHISIELDRILQQPDPSAVSVEGLLRVPRPLDERLFQSRRYMALEPGTIEQLFRYYLGTNALWDGLERLPLLDAQLDEAADDKRDAARQKLVSHLKNLQKQSDKILKLQTSLVQQLAVVAALPDS